MFLSRIIQPLKHFRCYVNPNKLLHTNATNVEHEIINGLKILSLSSEKDEAPHPSTRAIEFSPRSIQNIQDVLDKRNIGILDVPFLPQAPSLPPSSNKSIMDLPLVDLGLECPAVSELPEKHAVRLIVIRRKKMKKHKLKKLRKKMKYVWARLRKRREIKKEKAFRASVFAKVKEAEDWSAEQYVAEKLREANEEPIPRYWKGKRLPRFLIRQLMGLDPKIKYNQFKNTN